MGPQRQYHYRQSAMDEYVLVFCQAAAVELRVPPRAVPKRAEHTGDRSALHSQASLLNRNPSLFFAGKRHVWVEEVLPAQAATVPIWAGDSETMNERHLGKAEAESSQEVQKEKGVNRRGSLVQTACDTRPAVI